MVHGSFSQTEDILRETDGLWRSSAIQGQRFNLALDSQDLISLSKSLAVRTMALFRINLPHNTYRSHRHQVGIRHGPTIITIALFALKIGTWAFGAGVGVGVLAQKSKTRRPHRAPSSDEIRDHGSRTITGHLLHQVDWWP